MNFKGHLTGGIVTGCLVCALASSYTIVDLRLVATLICISTIFALFPDLDISSIPQRWFYRFVFVALILLSIQENYKLASLIAIIALTPILSSHRGWTHNPVMACLSPFVFAFFYEYLLSKSPHLYTVSFNKVLAHLNQHTWYVIACIMGWFSHLILDSRKLKFLHNSANHH